MDFNLDETQQDVRKLAAEVLAKDGGEAGLRQAGLLSLCVPEEAGGAGLGPVEMAVVLREVGAKAAAVPALPALAGTLALARYGSPGQQRRHADGVALAVREPGRALAAPPATVATVATPAREDGGGWTLTGRKATVVHPGPAALVTADEGLFLVTAPAATPEYTSTGEPAATLTFDATPAERVAGPEAADGLRRLYTGAIAAQASGVLAGALELTTAHIRTRRQFGRALAEFQAVTVQIADVYIAGRALDVAMWSALWRLGAGLPAEEDLALAAYHAAEAVKALHICQHLHGGLGLDVTYPLHRYFAQAKHLSHLLGGADAQLDLIGALV
ncbi:acyl-CoA/acyl-ACP dehydrogenase [Actinomadura sp. ATCC 31491]|uniref:Acyl-CoA/acyl-ACP dehydrogenase n=1 Tax=Actinomadura luzonensis TaxID=2805427 RepID=A0ABT0FLP6_9ACTN|nr:acyl-CoA dehydrogenase family protein [Actinomadura luzonensis]MCK2212863.1 acyl-CoA/acyl-ACP dehydrogenase [Actinomadura luzonensis]